MVRNWTLIYSNFQADCASPCYFALENLLRFEQHWLERLQTCSVVMALGSLVHILHQQTLAQVTHFGHQQSFASLFLRSFSYLQNHMIWILNLRFSLLFSHGCPSETFLLLATPLYCFGWNLEEIYHCPSPLTVASMKYCFIDLLRQACCCLDSWLMNSYFRFVGLYSSYSSIQARKYYSLVLRPSRHLLQ